MALDAIEVVKRAETKAEETLRSASQQAAQLVSEAEKEAAGLFATAEDKARENAAARVAGAHEESRKILEKASQDLAGEMQALCEAARTRQADAVKMILQALV